MSGARTDFEALLREALIPVDPPAGLAARLERTLVNLNELAQDELESWELSAMGDPRTWARTAAAVVMGASAGTALVVLRVRRHQYARSRQSSNLLALAQEMLRDVATETRRVLPDR